MPTGIATDDTYKQFFADLNEKNALASLYDFENREALFPAVDSRMKFCLLTLSAKPTKQSQFAFFCTNVNHLRDARRRFSLAPIDLALFNPNTRTVPVFRTRADAELTKKVYERVPVLVNDGAGDNPWNVRLMRVFNMGVPSIIEQARTWEEMESSGYDLNQVSRFCKDEIIYLPVYEGKMFGGYNHRAGSVELRLQNAVRAAQSVYATETQLRDPNFLPTPAFWMPLSALTKGVPQGCSEKWVVAYKDITATTNERTMIAAYYLIRPATSPFVVPFSLHRRLNLPVVSSLI